MIILLHLYIKNWNREINLLYAIMAKIIKLAHA